MARCRPLLWFVLLFLPLTPATLLRNCRSSSSDDGPGDLQSNPDSSRPQRPPIQLNMAAEQDRSRARQPTRAAVEHGGSRARRQPKKAVADQGSSVALKSRMPSAGIAKVVDKVSDRVMEGRLPVFVPSGKSGKDLKLEHFSHNFSAHEVKKVNYSRSHGLSGDAGGEALCTNMNTIFDIGFYDGADTTAYVNGGYCVVGVEADPDLVYEAINRFAVWIATGQLRLARVAIAPAGDLAAWKMFYRSKCSKEWNSFYQNVGCRSCHPPHAVDLNACEQVNVVATQCSAIFSSFGVPSYLKLDIEGAETGCFQAMQQFPPGTPYPMFVSAEITQVDYIATMHNLGYQGFKLVRQDRLATETGSTTGPWGDAALDCRHGPLWRSFQEAYAEMQAILQKNFDPNDPCPGGILPIHGAGGAGAGMIWYDLHARLQMPMYR